MKYVLVLLWARRTQVIDFFQPDDCGHVLRMQLVSLFVYKLRLIDFVDCLQISAQNRSR
jgi:hypothetical protein